MWPVLCQQSQSQGCLTLVISVLLLEFGQTHEELVPPLHPGWEMLLVVWNQLAHLLQTSREWSSVFVAGVHTEQGVWSDWEVARVAPTPKGRPYLWVVFLPTQLVIIKSRRRHCPLFTDSLATTTISIWTPGTLPVDFKFQTLHFHQSPSLITIIFTSLNSVFWVRGFPCDAHSTREQDAPALWNAYCLWVFLTLRPPSMLIACDSMWLSNGHLVQGEKDLLTFSHLELNTSSTSASLDRTAWKSTVRKHNLCWLNLDEWVLWHSDSTL